MTLGLVRDDETHYAQRLKLWEEFNTCWLATLQKQKAMTQEMVHTGQRPQPPKTLIDYDSIEKMGTQLIKNCDTMEKHGLVDYQMGVWEEEIVASQYQFLPVHRHAESDQHRSVDILPRSFGGSRRRLIRTATYIDIATTMIASYSILLILAVAPPSNAAIATLGPRPRGAGFPSVLVCLYPRCLHV